MTFMNNITLCNNAQLALDTILQKPVKGIPSWLIHPMEHRMIDRLAGMPEGSYVREPEKTYMAMQHRVGTCMLDQYIPENPLSISDHGYQGNAPTHRHDGRRADRARRHDN